MTRRKKREQMLRRLSEATCRFHGFGPGPWGDAARLAHIEFIARAVEEAKGRKQ